MGDGQTGSGETMTAAQGTNPVLAQSGLPYDLPDFASISDDDFLPAFTEAVASHVAEVEAIAADPAAPTFANTIEALELSGRDLARASGIFFNLVGPDTNPRRNEISQELSTLLTDHANTIAMNPVLFERISDLHSRADELHLTEAQRRLLDKRYRESVRAGAGLDPDAQGEMREIASRLAYLTTTFSQKILDDTNDSAVLVDDVAALDGLSAGQIAAARRAAAEAGHDSGYLLTLELPTSQSVLTEVTNADVRRRVFDASVGRCARGNEHDTRELVLDVVRLRARRAEMLGYRDHAEYVIAEQTAPHPGAVDDMLRELNSSAMRAGGRELTRLTEFAGDAPIGPADLTFWLDREKRSHSAVPLDDFADYCELDAVLTRGVFFAANKLYGLTFREITDLPLYHPDVRAWEVRDDAGVGIGLFLGDFFARPSKRGGAWMNNIVDQSSVLHTQPIIVNVLNLTRCRTTVSAHDGSAHHAFPRVRARPARIAVVGRLPVAIRDIGTAGLRRVPVAGERDVGAAPGRAGELRPASRDRRADPGRARRCGAGVGGIRVRARHHRIPRRILAGPGLAPVVGGGGRGGGRRRGLRGAGAHRRGIAHRADPAALPELVLQPHLRWRLLRRLLQLHLVGGARRRDRAVVPRRGRVAS